MALRNLDHGAEFIAADDPQAARQVVSRVLDAVTMLALQPGVGRPGRVPGTRELVVSKTRYTCPSCELHAWAKPGARLMCGDCEILMEAPEGEGEDQEEAEAA